MSKITEMPKKLWDATPFGGPAKPLVTHIDMTGMIATDSRTGKRLNLRRLEKAIDAAFKPTGLKAVAISVNSPGGSPVQSRLIHDRIRDEAKKKGVPVYTFIEDVGASGGYILSIAGDEIYADPSSIVGSIGVISGGFGFPDAISRIGVERRIYTAGSNKSQLDPFKPEDPEDIRRLNVILDELHAIFIDLVKTRRGEKLTGAEDEIFSGQYWSARPAKDYGLIDGIGELRSVMKEKFGEDVKIKKIETDERSLVQKLLSHGGLPGGMPQGLVDPGAVADLAEEKALWGRYGL